MDDVKSLLAVLPNVITDNLDDPDTLVEIVIDEGRPVEYRYVGDQYVEVVDLIGTPEMIAEIEKNVGAFGPDNRAGLSLTLHRISRILNRFSQTVGLTCRVGRPFEGCVELIKDLVDEGHNILLLGKPGIGKTTKLRDVARHLSSELTRRTIIIDTSNEIGGDGNLPHPAVGRSRRMQVPNGKRQHEIMKEAVENHMPQAIIIDEISDIQETEAARTIAQRGVQLVATAHGSKLEELMQNPPLAGLIGGIRSVQIGDALMRQRGLDRKTILERQFPPVFDVVVELIAFDEVCIHRDVAKTVDTILTGGEAQGEIRRLHDGQVLVIQQAELKPGIFTGNEDDSRSIGARLRSQSVGSGHNKKKR